MPYKYVNTTQIPVLGYGRDARDAAVTEYCREYGELQRLEREMVTDPGTAGIWRECMGRLKSMEPVFLATLPRLRLARCPYTGELVHASVDVFGTGSPWWRDEGTVRNEFEGPSTLFAVDGALHLDGMPEESPFTVLPGPEKPFVIPEILSRSEIRAVLYATPITGGTVWWMVYFAYPMVYDHARVNDYARDCYTILLDSGTRIAYSDAYPDFLLDFDLAPWVKSGKLLWISPGDAAMKLHATLDGCPYLNEPGEARRQMIVGNWKGWLGKLREPIDHSLVRKTDPGMEARFQKGLAHVKEGGTNG